MMKKLLLLFLLFVGFSAAVSAQEITLTTTTASNAWSPFDIDNRGAVLEQFARGGIIFDNQDFH